MKTNTFIGGATVPVAVVQMVARVRSSAGVLLCALNLFRIVGQALRLPSFAVWHRQAGRLPYKLSLGLLMLSACASPRVLEVSSHTRLQDVNVADRELFTHDKASRLRYEPQDLSADAQREEFLVRWTPSTVELVKFEYRQVNKPNTVMTHNYTAQGFRTFVFAVRGEEFHSGGPVSAWRVSLWSGDTLLAERKSTLW